MSSVDVFYVVVCLVS